MSRTPVPRYAVVIPTVGRRSLHRLLDTLAGQHTCARHPGPVAVVVVDDRARPVPALSPPEVPFPISVLRSGGRGPAAARNVGWRSARAEWVVFLDDDVELPPGWSRLLSADLAGAGPGVAGVQARLTVPLPAGRPATDWERNTAALADAFGITADMAYRRAVLEQVAGFDERFPRAYREDADIALRVREHGWRIAPGGRVTVHPVRPAGPWVSVRAQSGAADDALMRRLHGRHWRERARTGRGRFRVHVATTVAAAATAALTAVRHRRAARVAAAVWIGLTAEFIVHRLAPGPGPRIPEGWAEAARMVATSPVIPLVAVWHRLRGTLRHRAAQPWPPRVRAVLFDRDGTLVRDVPYNGDPDRVIPTPEAGVAVKSLRRSGFRVGVVTNQSGVGRGLLTPRAVSAVNRRVDDLIGPFDVWRVCPHAPEAGCLCRKPGPGLVLSAARALGVAGYECAVIGDIGADVEAAVAAGARPILGPTTVTREPEIDAAPVRVASLTAAADLLLDPARRSSAGEANR